MLNKQILLFAFLMIGGVGSSNFSFAEDFNLNVPVQLNNLLPTVKKIKIYCSARHKDNIRDDIGGTEKEVNVPESGNLSTTVSMKFNAWPGDNPSDANKYVCYFHLWTADLGYFPPGIGSAPEAQFKTGTILLAEIVRDIS